MQITHCPQCATAFKVTLEQLQQAKGWVRCGRCKAVFESHQHWGMPKQSGAVNSAASSSIMARARTWLWIVLTFIAASLVLLQLVLWQRDWLAAEEPALHDVLSQLCAPLGCEVHWPREPDALVIESSSFSQSSEGGYKVPVLLKNNQHHAVASPSLELTLTDPNDEVVLRRIFSAQELSLPDHMAALRDMHTTLYFDLDANLSQRVAGFRALIFYP